jgi:hypothetical protein
MVLFKAIVEAIWIQKLFYELGFYHITPTTITLVIKMPSLS